MKIKAYQSEFNKWIEMESIGKLRYIGDSNLVGFINNNVYDVVGIEEGLLRVIDETEEDYLYSSIEPQGGRWELVEDYKGLLKEHL